MRSQGWSEGGGIDQKHWKIGKFNAFFENFGKLWKILENLRFSHTFAQNYQKTLNFQIILRFSRIWTVGGQGEGGLIDQKHWKIWNSMLFWKILENYGKLKVFQYFCSKLSKNLQFSNYFEILKDLAGRREGWIDQKHWKIWKLNAFLESFGKLWKILENWRFSNTFAQNYQKTFNFLIILRFSRIWTVGGHGDVQKN